MKKFHLALNVSDIETSVYEYTIRFQKEPDLVIPGEYAFQGPDTVPTSNPRSSIMVIMFL